MESETLGQMGVDRHQRGQTLTGGDLAESGVGFEMSDKGNVKTGVVVVELKE